MQTELGTYTFVLLIDLPKHRQYNPTLSTKSLMLFFSLMFDHEQFDQDQDVQCESVLT